MSIKAILADIDGTLITNGNLSSIPEELTAEIQAFRSQEGGLFSLVSGRDKPFQEKLRIQIFGVKKPLANEALIYEDTCLVLGSGEDRCLGGLFPETLAEIDQLKNDHPEAFKGMVPLPNTEFTVRRGYVTKEFARGEKTNSAVLQKAYDQAKRLAKEISSSVRISKSTDGLDFTDQNTHKGVPFKEYLSILENRAGIFPESVLVIGDAGNDLEILNMVQERGGIAAFVGTDENLVARLAQKGVYISQEKGPEGTLEVIRKYSSKK